MIKITTLFPDTNLFLQARALAEIPWGEHFDADGIRILIGVTVQREIDRRKTDRDSRIGGRARRTNSEFRKILDAYPGELEIRDRNPRVLLGFADALPSSRVTPVTLDPMVGDDLLIEEAIYFHETTGEVATIVTMDTGVELLARRHSVPVFRIPDTWLLPAEPDLRGKQMRELERRVAALEKSQPEVLVNPCDSAGEPLEKYSVSLDLYESLTEEEIRGFELEVRAKYPMQSLASNSSTGAEIGENSGEVAEHFLFQQHGPGEAEFDAYRKSYASWLEKSMNQFRRLPVLMNLKRRMFPFGLLLSNEGSVPADELILELSVSEGLRLCINLEDQEEFPAAIAKMMKFKSEIVLSPPPAAPRPRSLLDAVSSLADTPQLGISSQLENHFLSHGRHSLVPASRARHEFYAREQSDSIVAEEILECQEFRHGIGAREIHGWMFVPVGVSVSHAHLRCRISARNMPQALTYEVPISVAYNSVSALEVASRWR